MAEGPIGVSGHQATMMLTVLAVPGSLDAATSMIDQLEVRYCFSNANGLNGLVTVLILTAGWFAYRKDRAGRALNGMIELWLDAYRRGAYEEALRVAESIKRPAYCFFRGSMLLQLGKLDEAERLLRESVSNKKETDKEIGANYAALAELLSQRRRYDEALKCCESSLRFYPNRSSTHREIVEVWLRRGDGPAEALRFARLAVEEGRSVKALTPEIHDLDLSGALATLAWATAVVDNAEEAVDGAVAEAILLSESTKVIPVIAQVHYQAGCAYRALGNTGKGEHHFQEAARIDRKGIFGRAAREMLGT